MKKLISTLTLFAAMCAAIVAQVPQAFKYQAIARHTDGSVIVNEDINVRISILLDETIIYREVHNAHTNTDGLIVLNIGQGQTVTGNFLDIDWATDLYFLQVEIADPSQGAYQVLGRSKLQSVPFALYAEKAGTVDNVDDADANPFNEIQALSLSGDTLYLSLGGGSVKLPTGDYNNLATKTALADSTALLRSEIPDVSGYLSSETDPAVTSNFDFSAAVTGDLLRFDGTKWVKFTPDYLTSFTETDPVFGSSQANNITLTHITNLNNLSGINTGDQDLSNLATKTALADSTALLRSEIPDVSGYISSETDPSVTLNFDFSGAVTGDLLRFDGTKWVKFTPDYLTSYTETDPVYSSSVAAGITVNDTSQWDTAYSWGNHAAAGYLTTEIDADITNEFQDLTSSKTGNNVTINILNGTGTSFNTDDADANPENELQQLYVSGDSVFITSGNGVKFVVSNDSTAQNLNLNNSINFLGITGGTGVFLDKYDQSEWTYDSIPGAPVNISYFTNDAGYITSYTETDPVFESSQANNITLTHITNLSNLSGINTGDQDLSNLATKTALADSTALLRSEIPDVSGFLSSETDPIVALNFNFSGAVTGDLLRFDGTKWVKFTPDYLTSYTETDPAYSSSVASEITTTDTSHWNTAYTWGNHAIAGYLTSYSETDPVFSASLASDITGADTANWNNKLSSYTETDPVFEFSQANNITLTHITNLNNLSGINTGDQDLSNLATKTALADSTALLRSEIPDVSGYLSSETDPAVTSNFDFSEAFTGDLLRFDGTKWVKFTPDYLTSFTETDPVFDTSQANNITLTHITNLNNLSGINTGDQDLSNLATKTALADSTDLLRSEIPDVSGFLSNETDPAVASNFDFSGAVTGDLLRFDGTKWVKFTPDYLTSYTETDPVYSSSVASEITTTDTSHWNTAYKWGNHASAGYITSTSTNTLTNKSGNISMWTNDAGYVTSATETDPAYSSSVASEITTTDTLHWNTAYTWGNHAGAGYLTLYNETDPVFSASLASNITGTDTANWNNKLDSYTETDPVYSSSVASEITTTDTSHWNTAYTWGNHAGAGYLTFYNETDPVFSASLASNITGTDTANWNNKLDSYAENDPIYSTSLASEITAADTAKWDEAYSWGDHSAAGYLTSFTEVDGNITNEIQALSFSNDTLYLSDGGEVYLGNYAETTGDTVDLDHKVLALSKITASGYDTSTLDDGLTAYFPFNKNANDESGNGNNGTVNGAIITSDRFDNDSSAYIFDGLDDGIEISYNPSLWPGNGDFSFSAWIKLKPYTLRKKILNLGSSMISRSLIDFRLASAAESETEDGVLFFALKDDYGVDKSGVGNTVMTDDLWHHVTIVVNRQLNQAYIFVDANEDGTFSIAGLQSVLNTDIDAKEYIGCRFNYEPGASAEGKIDDVRFYNRALSESEIQSLYHENNYENELKFYDPINGDLALSDLKNDFSSGGEEGGAIRTLGNTDNYGLGLLTNNDTSLYITENGNVGIGTTNPATALDVNGVITATGGNSTNWNTAYTNAGNAFKSGGEAGGAVRTLGNTDNYGLGFLTNNDTSLYIDENGNVGIGTTNAYNKLIIESNADDLFVLKSSYVHHGLRLNSTCTGGKEWAIITAGNTSPHFPAGSINFRYESDSHFTAMTITQTGNIGIGTTTPQNKLDVEGGTVIGASYSGTNTAPTNGLLVEGNVGIGTNNPSSPLHIESTNTTSDFRIARFYNSTLSTGKWLIMHIGKNDSPRNCLEIGYENIGDNSVDNRALIGLQSHIHSLVIKGNEYIGIGTANPLGKFHINGTVGDGDNVSGAGDDVLVTSTGNLGVGTTDPKNKLDVEGGAVIGASYSGANTAPANGLLVEGNVGIGTNNPGAKLHVANSVSGDDIKFETTTDSDLGIILEAGTNNNRYMLSVNNEATDRFEILDESDYILTLRNKKLGLGIRDPFAKITAKGASGDTTFATINSTGDTTMVVLDNGNVGIGTTSSGTKLTILDNSAVDSDGQEVLRIQGDYSMLTPGSGPMIRFASLANGFAGSIRSYHRSGAGQAGMLFTVNNNGPVEAMMVDCNGNIGINTNTPSGKLHVQGGTTGSADSAFVVTNDGKVGIGTYNPGAKLQISTNDPEIRLRGTATTGTHYNKLSFYNQSGSELFELKQSDIGGTTDLVLNNKHAEGDFLFQSEGKNLVWFESTGNVGVNTTSPSGKLHIQGGTTGSTDSAFVVNSDGNVGIGTDSPDAKLTVNGMAQTAGKGVWQIPPKHAAGASGCSVTFTVPAPENWYQGNSYYLIVNNYYAVRVHSSMYLLLHEARTGTPVLLQTKFAEVHEEGTDGITITSTSTTITVTVADYGPSDEEVSAVIIPVLGRDTDGLVY